MTNERETKMDSGAWSTASGAPVPRTEVAPATGDRSSAGGPPGTSGRKAAPETTKRGTDQESNVPGRAKPASEPANSAPPNSVPGAPQH